MEIEVFDVESLHPPPTQTKPPPSGGAALAGVLLSIVVGLQLIPDPPNVEIATVSNPIPEDTAVEGVEVIAPFQWVEVGGLDRFETVTEPVTTDSGFLAVGNPSGISRAASVVVSKDGSQWNRWGTIHGVGGDVQISEVERSRDQYLAFGSYTEEMPKNEWAIPERIPAVWISDHAIGWDMQGFLPDRAVDSAEAMPLDELASLRLEGSIDYVGEAGDAVAVLLTTTRPTVSVREPGMTGDSFATRVNAPTRSLLISRDRVQWASEVVPFVRIDFIGDVNGTFLIRAWSGVELGESSVWLVTP